MFEFPSIPKWWGDGTKFMRLNKGYSRPQHIIGFDTETANGHIFSQQFVSQNEKSILWVNDDNCLEKFFKYLERFEGNSIMYAFNLSFDLALVFREAISEFLQDDFEFEYDGWDVQVYCSSNWFANLKKGNRFIRILDVTNYFTGSLDSVSRAFGMDIKKLKTPKDLGERKYNKTDKAFIEYAMMDAELCYEMGKIILGMHEEFDIPISTSSANFAEKVFRRQFIKEGQKIRFTPPSATRLAELSYHGGKNAYYLEHPALVRNCYEYDFNSAYPYAMFHLPSFTEGRFRFTRSFNEKFVGVYKVSGRVSSCPYGILYDTRFNYIRDTKRSATVFITSYELEEAIRSREFKLDQCTGWIWVPESEDSPLRNYIKYFWELKNKTPKGDVKYIFWKLLLNSLYGKWIQRNPTGNLRGQADASGKLELYKSGDVSGGLYHPFIASLITGRVRAKLHKEEHRLEAIDVSTDSVKSKKYVPEYEEAKYLGNMQLEEKHCGDCDRKIKKFDILFLRNRLNLVMDKKEHILKAALHGFWGKPDLLKKLWKERRTEYEVKRMPKIYEALTTSGKELFMMQTEERALNFSWDNYKEI